MNARDERDPIRVLVVEDDPTVRTLVRMLLEDEGLVVDEAAGGTEAIEAHDKGSYGLIILDVRLPGVSGFDVCRHIRRTSDVPIVMVTAQDDSHDVVTGLELGADDYVTKPFNDRELLARIRVQLRRRPVGVGDGHIVVGALELYPDQGLVRRHGAELSLTRTEFQLLCHLARHLERVWSREQLLHHVWGYDYAGDGRLVDSHVARLRAKIEDDPAEPKLLLTVRGLGYRLVRPTR